MKMSSLCQVSRSSLLLIFFFVGGTSLSLRAAPLSGDSLTITGDSDLQGDNLTLGTANSSDPGITFTYNDGVTATITMTSFQDAIKWEWWHNHTGGAQISMRLNENNQLLLFNAAGTTAGITLNPTGTSAFANGITIGGSAVLTSAAAASTYLTPATANSTYVRQDVFSVALGEGTSASENAVALGYYGTASGDRATVMGVATTASAMFSTAIGLATTASGDKSMAMGAFGTASGEFSTAMGAFGTASGEYSTAMGAGTTASGYNSTAMGAATTASGDYSTTMGVLTTAQSYAQFVIGQYNVPQGNATSWIATDDLFIIGNGPSYSSPSNAFVVKKNGNTAINGDAAISGQLEVSNKARFDQAVRIAPQGDISMGEFTSEP